MVASLFENLLMNFKIEALPVSPPPPSSMLFSVDLSFLVNSFVTGEVSELTWFLFPLWFRTKFEGTPYNTPETSSELSLREYMFEV